ncbi:HEPN domain-containing protein [Candidatus Gottesmanbacteria bacterium]|nr:HEPN domain-containing protein [Candidatus Gottesmanbacteria bacterium]
MTQEEVVAFWKQTSDKDWEFSQEVYAGGKRYDYALFFVHLSLEKLLKGLHYHRKDSHPLAIHDLVELAKRAEIEMPQSQVLDLKEISSFNLSARYDDYKKNFYKKANKEYADVWIQKAKKIRTMLIPYFSL